MLRAYRVLAGATVAACLVLAGEKHTAHAQASDSPCFVRDPSGRVADLSYLCGPAPEGGRLPSVAAKTADCKRLEQALVPFLKEMETSLMTMLNTDNQQSRLRQATQMSASYDRLINRVSTLPMADTRLMTLRAQYVRGLKESNAVLKRTLGAAQGGNLKTATSLLPTLQSFATQSAQIGQEIDRYCGFIPVAAPTAPQKAAP